MPSYPYQADIETSRLRLDTRNPRVASEADTQRQALEALATEQKAKLLVLARHIAEKGLNPAQRFIVIPDDENFYIVLDANRRLAALKILEHPELVQGILGEGQVGQLRTLANRYDPPDDVPCVVFGRREDADVWVELLHEGQGDGAGLVEWTAQQKARHRARREQQQPPYMQVLEFVMSDGNPSTDARERNRLGKYPVSTLERALSSPYLRERLGIEIDAGRVVTDFPKEEVLRGLTKLVDEIGTGKVKVGEVMSKDDRARYADRFKAEDLPQGDSRGETFAPLAEAPAKAALKPKERKHSRERTKMVRPEFSVEIPVTRINDIYLELKRKLWLRDVPNAAAVLFRTFIELSIDDYIRRNLDPVKLAGKHLHQKQEAVLADLQTKGRITRKEMIPLREAVKEADDVTVFTNLNAFVHNPSMTPSDSELRAIWDRFENLVRLLWE